MRRIRRAFGVAALLVILAVAGCAADAQPSSGPGWRLIDIRGGNVGPGIDIKPIGDDAYLVELTVNGPGGNDCARPRFLGFEARGEVLVAGFQRPAIAGTCLVTNNRVFDVLVERRFIPPGVTRLELNEPCGGELPAPGCPKNGVPIVGPGGPPAPEPAGSFSAPPS
ncbi:MAG: hypothetical protein M3067_14775 [Chloroflexota bacterium]|nr:hypothetical protein [Chloroflexota bacterium]